MCGVDSLNFPPTIAKLVSNILGNLHLIFLSYPVSKVYSFTFQRKGPPIYGSWTSTVLENCPVSLLFQSCTQIFPSPLVLSPQLADILRFYPIKTKTRIQKLWPSPYFTLHFYHCLLFLSSYTAKKESLLLLSSLPFTSHMQSGF